MAGLVLAFLTAGLLLLFGWMLFQWAKERRATPADEKRPVPRRYRLYALLAVAAGGAFEYVTSWRFPGMGAGVALLAVSLLKGIDEAYLWMRRDERPPSLEDSLRR